MRAPTSMASVPLRPLLSALIGVIALAGCGGMMSEQQCRKGDWYERGAKDGLHGKPPSALADYAKACSEYRIRPDAEAWASGHREGLNRYCSDEHGYDAGKAGAGYENACAERPEAEAAFLAGYRRGLMDRVAGLQDDLARMSNALRPTFVTREDAEALTRRRYALLFDLQRARWLLAQRAASERKAASPASPSPASGEEALLAHLRAGDPELEHAARAITAGGDAAARRAASAQLVAVARTLTSARWREDRRTQLGPGRTPQQVDRQLVQDRDDQLATTLAAMRAIGGAEVVAYCFELAEDDYAPTRLRQAALTVVAQHVDPRDAAARARGAALWDRVAGRIAAEAAGAR